MNVRFPFHSRNYVLLVAGLIFAIGFSAGSEIISPLISRLFLDPVYAAKRLAFRATKPISHM
jgi:hypothetical protein